MRKKISAALLAFMLVFQVLSSGYAAPFTALATDTTIASDETTTDESVVADALELQQEIDKLFQDDGKIIQENVVLGNLETLKVKLNNTQLDDETKQQLQAKLDLAEQQLKPAAVLSQDETAATSDEKEIEKTNEVTTTEKSQSTTKKTNEVTTTEKSQSITKKTKTNKIADDETSNLIGATVKFNNLVIKQVDNKTTIYDGDNSAAVIIHQGDLATVNYTFEIPAGTYNSSDYFTFKLPENMLVYTAKTGILKGIGTSTDTQWTYTVNPTDKSVTINAPQTSENYERILTGGFGLEAMFDNFSSQTDKVQELVIPGASATVKITVEPQTSGTYLKKENTKVSFDSSEKRIAEWKIIVNPDGQTLKNLTLADTLPDGMKLNGKINVKEYSVALNGESKEKSTTNYAQFPIEFGDTSSSYELTYETEILETALENKSGSVEFENKATLTADNLKETSATGKAVVKLAVPIEKTLDENKDNTPYKMNWIVKYNFNQATLTKNDVVLTDTVTSPNNMHKITGTVKATEFSIDKKGVITKGKTYEITPTFKEGSSNVATIDLSPYYDEGGSKKAFILEYVTETTDYNLIAKNGTEDITNTITDGTNTSIPWSSKGTKYTTGFLKKDVTNVNYEEKIISWKITLTPPNGKKIKKATIKDSFVGTDSLQLDASTIKVTAESGSAPQYKPLTENSKIGFNLEFIEEIASPITITYDTKMLNPGADGQNYNNNLAMDWEIEGVENLRTETTGTYIPNTSTQKNGYKKGTYNHETNQIDWEVAFNFNKNEIGGATITDVAKDQELTSDVKLYKLKLDTDAKNGENNNNTGKIDGDAIKTYDEKDIACTANTFCITLDNDLEKSAYILKYSTKPTAEVLVDKMYTNTATVTKGDKDIATLPGEVTHENAGNLVEKSYKANGESGVISWTVDINKSGSTLTNLQFTDEFSDNQALLEKTVKLCKIVISKEGTTSVTDCEDVDFTKKDNEFKVELPSTNKDTATAYQLQYDTLYTGKDEGGFSNKATIEYGENINKEASSNVENKTFKYDDSWGFISMGERKSGTLTLTKTATQQRYDVNSGLVKYYTTDDTPTIDSTPLEGVKFELWNPSKSIKLYEGTSDENGKVVFKDVVNTTKDTSVLTGKYILVEKAKEGYEGISQLTVKVVEGSNGELKIENSTSIDKNTVNNQKYVQSLLLTKVDEDNAPLKDIEFTLQKKSNDIFKNVDSTIYKTDANGKIFIEGLEAGEYQLAETKTLSGYVLKNSETFKIEVNKNTAPIQKTLMNEPCKITLTNIDEDGAYVKDGKFTIIDSNENVVDGFDKKAFDNKGTSEVNLKGLPNGEYTITITPATGYGEATTQKFTVSNEMKECLKLFTFVTKTPDEKCVDVTIDYTLTNNGKNDLTTEEKTKAYNEVVFKLTPTKEANGKENQKNQTPITGLTVNSEGKIIITNSLKPGYYELTQTTTPDGFNKAGSIEIFISPSDCSVVKKDTTEKPVVTSEECPDFEITLKGATEGTVKIKVTGPNNQSYELINKGGSFEADSTSSALPTKLQAGSYKIERQSISNGYKLIGKTSFTVINGACATPIELKIEKCADITFNYVIPENAAENARFELKDSEGKTLKPDLQVANGKVTIPSTELAPGKYILVQTTATTGFEKVAQVDFTITENSCLTEMTLTPKECDDFVINYDGPAGSEFTLKADGQSYELVVKEDNGKKTFIAKDETTALPEHLTAGDYTLTQTKVPTGYTKVDTVEFTVTNGTCEEKITVVVKECIDFTITYTGPAGSEFNLVSKDGTVKYELIATTGNELVLKGTGDSVPTAIEPGEYKLVQTKTPAGYEKSEDQTVTVIDTETKDKNVCVAPVIITMVACPDFSIIYNGPTNSQAEFKLVELVKDDGGKVTEKETPLYEGIKVKTETTTVDGVEKKIQKLDLPFTALEAGEYKLVQTKAHPGYDPTSKTFTVVEGVCSAELTVYNSPTPPPLCSQDTVITVKDTDGKVVEVNENTKVTVDGKEVAVTITDGKVVIPKDAVEKGKDVEVKVTLEDGRTTTETLSKDRIECTVAIVVPLLKVCEENPTVTITTTDGKNVSTDLVEKVTVNGKEVPVKVENGKVVIPKEQVNPKEETIIVVTLKDGHEGTVTIPKYSEECNFTIVVENACDSLTINVTKNDKKATSGTVEIIDKNGKVVATKKVGSTGKVTFEAKYANSDYAAKVTIGDVKTTMTVSVDKKCAMTINVVDNACEKATVNVTYDGKPYKGADVKVVDEDGKTVQSTTTDKNGQASIKPKYANKKYKVKVTVDEETKTFVLNHCEINISFTPVAVDGDSEDPKDPSTSTPPKTPSTNTAGEEEKSNGSKDGVKVPSPEKPGHQYDLYDENGQLIERNVAVGKDGKVDLSKLPEGKYSLVSQDGGETIGFEVGKDGQLPKTGTDNQIWLYTMAGLALLALGSVMIGRNRKKTA